MSCAGLALALALLSQDSSALGLRRRVWDGLSALERVEQQIITRRAGKADTTAVRLLGDVR